MDTEVLLPKMWRFSVFSKRFRLMKTNSAYLSIEEAEYCCHQQPLWIQSRNQHLIVKK